METRRQGDKETRREEQAAYLGRGIVISSRLAPPLLVSLSPCLLVCLTWALGSAVARGDGGTVRLSQRHGRYQITVFTAPTPFRAGPVDVSVLVQDAATGEPVPQVDVTVAAAPEGQPLQARRYAATTGAATNKLFHAATFELPQPGKWEMEIVIEGIQRAEQVRFSLEAAEPAPRWLALWPWMSWPVLAVFLFGMHLWLRRRSRSRDAPRPEDTPGASASFAGHGR